MTRLRSGFLSSEFWLAVGGLAATIAVVFFGVDPGKAQSALERFAYVLPFALAVFIQGGIVKAYLRLRGRLKERLQSITVADIVVDRVVREAFADAEPPPDIPDAIP